MSSCSQGRSVSAPVLRRWVGLCLAAGVGFALVQPVVAEEPPAWAVENPGGAGARYGLGLGWLIERLDRLPITFQETTTELAGPYGGNSTVTTPGDPALLNRKFNQEWQFVGPVAQVPIALPAFGLGGARPLYSSLVLELTRAEIDLEISDRSAPNTDNSLSGNGAMAGAWLDLVMPLGRDWFGGGGFRYSVVPDLDLDHSSASTAPGSRVLSEETQLSGRRQEAFLRLGYAPPTWSLAPYLGVRYRSTSVTVDEELRLQSTQTGLETTIATRTRFESEGALAMAGVDARLVGRLFGRAEMTYGDDGTSLLVKLSYLVGGGTDVEVETLEELWKKREEIRKEKRKQKQERKRASEIAAEIAPKLALIEKEFVAGWRRLTVVELGRTGEQAYLETEVRDLLSKTERALLAALAYPELTALQDYVHARFRRVEARLGLERDAGMAAALSRGTLAAETVVLAAFTREATPSLVAAVQPAQDGAKKLPRGPTDAGLSGVRCLIQRLFMSAKQRKFSFDLTFRAQPRDGVRLLIYPRLAQDQKALFSTDSPRNVYIGEYSFEVRDGTSTVIAHCDANRVGPDPPCPLNLVADRYPFFDCTKGVQRWECRQMGDKETLARCEDL